MSIKIFYDDIDFRLKGWKRIKKLIEKVISNEKKISGDLIFIITNDESLKKLNEEYLKHSYFTDVISFNYGKGRKIDGEIYISIDTVKINAINYKISYKDEMVRVIIHGVLHLCGYEDNSKAKRIAMKKKEDFWLNVSKEI